MAVQAGRSFLLADGANLRNLREIALPMAHGSSDRTYHAYDMGLHARANPSYRSVLAAEPEVAAAAKQALTIGELMPKADWAQAKELAGGNGRVQLPQVFTDYAGRVVMVTGTHVVQQVAKSVVVVHTLAKLQGSELSAINAAEKLQGRVLVVSYGAVDGKAEAMQFDQVRAAAVNSTALEFAERNIHAPSARGNFLKHVDRMLSAEVERARAPWTVAHASKRDAREHGRTE